MPMNLLCSQGWKLIFCLLLLLVNNHCLAKNKTLNLNGSVVISQSTSYNNVTLNLNEGAFLVTKGATLDIQNSTINVTISPTNPYFIFILQGNLTLKNNIVNVISSNIESAPDVKPLYYLLQIQHGMQINVLGNQFKVNKSFTVGWFLTMLLYPTSGLNISDNDVRNFHGGVYLLNSKNGLISNNTFHSVSFGNIFAFQTNDMVITKNKIYFAGNNNIGDAIDIIQSTNTTVTHNFIGTGSCYSVVILSSKNVLIDNNFIVGGITYAVFISSTVTSRVRESLKKMLVNYSLTSGVNQNITIANNYFGQNRFGIGAINVDGLIVHNNIFVQNFLSNAARKFWTDNVNLLIEVVNLTWKNNLYKEAYSQVNQENKGHTKIFLTFPVTGGVTLPTLLGYGHASVARHSRLQPDLA